MPPTEIIPDRAGAIEPGLMLGDVMHVRFTPKRHQFRYRVASLLLDLDRLEEIAARTRTLSINRFNLFSFFEKDHGPRDGSPLKPWVEAAFAGAGRPIDGGRVLMMCFPRTLGYVFDPLTTYWGYKADGTLAGVLYQVKNTFGDQHCYMVGAPEGRKPGTPLSQIAEKCFHVSPFFSIDGQYRFRIDEPGDRLKILIRLVGSDGADRMIATHAARRVPLTDRALLKTLITHPLDTFKVIGAIHLEALRLLRKGAVFHKRPSPPEKQISIGHPVGAASEHRHPAQ